MKERSGNMNLDDPHDRAELSIYVKEYMLVEFVAVPPDFDINNYLTLREHVGQFDNKEIVLSQVKKIADAVRFTPVTSLLNNALLDPKVGMYLLSIFDELGLILKSIPNPLRKSAIDYKTFLDSYSNDLKKQYPIHIRGQEAQKVNIVIVNLFPMMNQHVIDEAMEIAQNLQKYQNEVNQKMKKVGNLSEVIK